MRITSVFVLCGLGGVASANAFVLAEHDAMATGRGNASVATDTDPSAIFYNPGGIAVAEGTAVTIGSSLIFASGAFTPEGSSTKTSTDTGPAVLPSIFVTSRVHELVTVGIGFHAPFGLAISWPTSAPTTDVIKEQSLRTYFISPVVGFNLNKYVPGLTIGGGLDIVPATVELTQYIFFGDTQGQAHLGAKATGFGGRIGAMYAPPSLKQLSVGVMWRSNVTEDFTGTGNFDIAAPYRTLLPADGPVSTSLTLPQAVTGGIAVRPIDNLEIELDAIWVNWAKFNTLAITSQANAGGTMTTTTTEGYENKTSFRAGIEYKLPEQNLAVRAGYIYDPTPIPAAYLTAQLPDVDRNDLTAGASYKFGTYAINASALVVLPSSRDTAMGATPLHKGKYDVSAFVASLSFTGRFGE